MNFPSKRVYDAEGKRIPHKMPPQPTVVTRSTARTLEYLEAKGLASFQSCNLVVQMNRGPANHRKARLEAYANYPNRAAV